MGELVHGERSKSRIRREIHTVKDGFLLLDVDRHFSKLKLASNGVEDQSRALGDSCSSLSLSRNRSPSQKLESPSVWLKICLKRHQWPKHGRGHGRALPQTARAWLGLITWPLCWCKHGRALGEHARALVEHARALVEHARALGGHGRALVKHARVLSQPCPCFGQCGPNSN
ncbi:unnamed protein product [Linum trigynum]|uniref:Uncharacterized protein n=1 Tax=Linum trigynum TaxID=586398 RepID=A0AAV2GMY4_9ROSI